MLKGGQSKQPTGASSGRKLNSSPRLTSSSASTTTSTRSVPRPEWGKNLKNTMPENKPRNKKSHTSGKKREQSLPIGNERNTVATPLCTFFGNRHNSPFLPFWPFCNSGDSKFNYCTLDICQFFRSGNGHYSPFLYTALPLVWTFRACIC